MPPTKVEQIEELAKIAATTATTVAVLATDIRYIRKELEEIKESLAKSYLTKIEFEPVRKIVYTLVGIVLTAVAGGLVALVINK